MADLMQCLWTARDIRPRNAPVASDRLTRLWHQAGQARAGTEFGHLTVKPRGLCRASVSGSGIAQEKNGSLGPDRPALGSWLLHGTGLLSLSLGFLTCKVKVITPSSQGCREASR